MKIKSFHVSPSLHGQIRQLADFYNYESPEAFIAHTLSVIVPARMEGMALAKKDIEAEIAAMRPENKISISDIRRAVLDEMGDQGTCVAGMKLRYEGRFIDDQIVQGSVTNEVYFQRIKEAMIAQGANESKFEIEYGWMD